MKNLNVTAIAILCAGLGACTRSQPISMPVSPKQGSSPFLNQKLILSPQLTRRLASSSGSTAGAAPDNGMIVAGSTVLGVIVSDACI